MSFPETRRIIFKNNPLLDVLCQFRFRSEGKRLSEEQVVEFSRSVNARFPYFSVRQGINIQISGAESSNVEPTSIHSYEFMSVDKKVRVVLSNEEFTIISSQYGSWEQFSEVWRYFNNNGLFELIDSGISRVGLRYRDLVQRSKIGLDLLHIAELLNDDLASLFLRNSAIGSDVLGMNSTYTVKLNERRHFMNASFVVVKDERSAEECLLIDGDFFTEGNFNYVESNCILNEFNVHARNFFQWCISEVLYESLGPENVG